MRTINIKLGEFEFVAHKFNLGETEEIVDLQEAMEGARGLRGRLIIMRKILLIAAQRDRPELGDDDLRTIEATPGELSQAVSAIMALNGYVARVSPGEEPAGPAA